MQAVFTFVYVTMYKLTLRHVHFLCFKKGWMTISWFCYKLKIQTLWLYTVIYIHIFLKLHNGHCWLRVLTTTEKSILPVLGITFATYTATQLMSIIPSIIRQLIKQLINGHKKHIILNARANMRLVVTSV